MSTEVTLPTSPALPGETVDLAALKVELDGALLDALRRASTRAEHVRLTRIAGLVRTLGLMADGGSGG